MRLLFGLCIFLTSASSSAISLQEAIDTAFKKNPITHANDLRLDAAKDRARGAKLDMLPSGNLSYSRGISKYNHMNDGVPSSSDNRSRGWNAGVSVNLFRGGADLNRARAAQKDVEVLDAQNNSTNALIPDTKGSLASEIFGVYSSLSYGQDQMAFLTAQKKNLEILYKAAQTEDQKNEIKTSLAGTENDIVRVRGNLERNILGYQYLVKMPFPGRVDNFDEMSLAILIPESPQEAIQIARTKSPDIKVALAALEGSEYRKKAELADAFSPRVDLGFNRGQNFVNGDGSSSDSIGTSVYVTVSVPFGASKFAYAAATRKEVEARQKDLDKEYERLEHEISDSYYPQLEGFSVMAERFRTTLITTTKEIDAILSKVQNGEKVDIRYALSVFSSQENQFYNFMDNLNFKVEAKFAIQKEVGILFEKIDESQLK